MLITAIIIVLAIRPEAGTIKERLKLLPKHALLGRLAWGTVDYLISYRHFMTIVTEVPTYLHAASADFHMWGGHEGLSHML